MERQGLLRLEYGGMTIVNLEGLRRYGEDQSSRLLPPLVTQIERHAPTRAI